MDGPLVGHGGGVAESVKGNTAGALNLWLLDASVLLASEDPDDLHHGDVSQLIEGGDPLATLDLAFYEAANVAIRSWRDHSTAHRHFGARRYVRCCSSSLERPNGEL